MDSSGASHFFLAIFARCVLVFPLAHKYLHEAGFAVDVQLLSMEKSFCLYIKLCAYVIPTCRCVDIGTPKGYYIEYYNYITRTNYRIVLKSNERHNRIQASKPVPSSIQSYIPGVYPENIFRELCIAYTHKMLAKIAKVAQT